MTASPSTEPDTGAGSLARTREIRRRSRAACDACRARKIKCLFDGPQCRTCSEFKIPCTQFQPRKRRGPKNRYVEKQREMEIIAQPVLSLSPRAETQSVLEKLGPMSIITHLIDDWFEAIHSVAPILHRRRFLHRLSSGDAERDAGFCGLVISLCAATIASLKRKCSASYRTITVEKCLDVIERHNLLGSTKTFTLEWCQSKYNLGVAVGSERGLDDVEGFRYLGEATMGMRYLVCHALQSMDFVEQQLLKRLYWLLFAGICTSDMYGRPLMGLISPQDDLDAIRPLDLSDMQLDPTPPATEISWHGDTHSYITGLNFLSTLFLNWHSSQQRHNRTIARIKSHIEQLNRALDDLPAELRWRGGLSRPAKGNFGTDVQIANLYITQLHIRSNLFEQLQTLLQTEAIGLHTNTGDVDVPLERQRIVDDLLEILSHTSVETLEANGHCLVPKIRDIGAALLEEVGVLGGRVSEKAQHDLERILQKLEMLDFHPEMSFGALMAQSPT